MKRIILSLCFLAFVASCSSDKQKPTDPDMDPAVAYNDDSVYQGLAVDGEAGGSAADEDPVAKGLSLIEGSDCLTCHKTDEALIGPSYKDVAAKYTEEDLDYLAEKIIEGGKGVWGEIPMSGHPSLDVEDAKTMVKFILSVQ